MKVWLIHPKKFYVAGLPYDPRPPTAGAPPGCRHLLEAPGSWAKLLTHRGRFALVVAGVLLQDVQGLGLGAGLTADTGAGTGLVAVIAPGRLAPIGREGIAGGKV